MEEIRRVTVPLDAVSIGVLLVTAFAPLPVDGIQHALGRIGAPSWRPVGEVVAAAIERLLDRHWLAFAPPAEPDTISLMPTMVARARLPELLKALPLSNTSPDIAYKLKIMGLDLLDGEARQRQIDELSGHWQGVLALWQEAERDCPCVQPSVRQWMTHNARLARSEIDWLASIAGS
jgi:hypothetical protein